MMPFGRPRGATHDIPLLDIRTEEDTLIFRGSPHDGTGAVLRGHVALSVRESTQIRSITLVFQGIKRLHWQDLKTPEGAHQPIASLMSAPSRTIKHEEVFYEKRWQFLQNGGRGYTMAPNNYAYDFSLPLDASLPESIEGIKDAHVVYRLKARVQRGMLAHDIVAKKHMRIVRTLAPGALELSQTMCVQNIWPNKVEYAIQIPSKAVVYGTYIPISIILLPLLKGLKIGKVICSLKETHNFTCPSRSARKTETKIITTKIFEDCGHFQDPDEIEYVDGHPIDPDSDFGRWTLEERIPLPKSLNNCVQDCETSDIKVKHKVSFVVQLHNPSDGHISELRATLPVMLFISPSYLMDASNSIPTSADTPLDDEGADLTLTSAPPRYDLHSLDRIYEGIPLRDFDTPAASAVNTPRILSRANSIENIQEHMSALHPTSTSSSGSNPENNTLQSGRVSGQTTPPQLSMGQSPRSSASSLSAPSTIANLPEANSARWRGLPSVIAGFNSMHLQNGHGTRTPPTPPAEEHLRTLCKVPSYSTAMRVGVRNLPDPNWEGLPIYDD